MRIAHSCCPAKTNIEPPEFYLGDIVKTSKGILQFLTCKGCKTEIIISLSEKENDITK